MLLICTDYFINECKILKKTDPHIDFQTSGDLSPSVEPTVHRAARIKVFGQETVRKIHKATQISATNLHCS